MPTSLIILLNDPILSIATSIIFMFIVLVLSSGNLSAIILGGLCMFGVMLYSKNAINDPSSYQVGTCFEYANSELFALTQQIEVAKLNKEDTTLLQTRLANAKNNNEKVIVVKNDGSGNIAYSQKNEKFFNNFIKNSNYEMIDCSEELRSKLN